MKRLFVVAAMLLVVITTATAQSTNGLSNSEIQGGTLVQKILQQWPVENYTNTGVLKIRGGNRHTDLPLKYTVTTSPINWLACYEVQLTTNANDVTKLLVTHDGSESNRYALFGNDEGTNLNSSTVHLTMSPFAESDFSIGDLGLEYFHWPQQKVLKREVRSSRGCTVLESTNPNPSTNGYSRVVSWIDTETLGIVEADAYDTNGKQLKIFTPKDFKKVNGQWQVQTFLMENVQTGSRSRLEFDLKK